MQSVLVVEDEGLIAADLCQILRDLGFDVPKPVDNAEEALRVAEEMRPSVVLMDIRLRGELDGTQAAQILREKLGIPVVFLSSHADETTLARAMAAQPYGYLLKPFREREVALAIQVALQRRAAESALAQGVPVELQPTGAMPLDGGGAPIPAPVNAAWSPRVGGARLLELDPSPLVTVIPDGGPSMPPSAAPPESSGEDATADGDTATAATDIHGRVTARP